MSRFENVSPLGALDLPLLGRVVQPGEVIEVTPEQARHLEGQEGTWRPVETPGAPAPTRGRNARQSGQGDARGDEHEQRGGEQA